MHKKWTHGISINTSWYTYIPYWLHYNIHPELMVDLDKIPFFEQLSTFWDFYLIKCTPKVILKNRIHALQWWGYHKYILSLLFIFFAWVRIQTNRSIFSATTIDLVWIVYDYTTTKILERLPPYYTKYNTKDLTDK